MNPPTHPPAAPPDRDAATNVDGPMPDARPSGPSTTGPHQNPEKAGSETRTTGPHQHE